ncbi:MAG TPA: 1-(5-phosphoribosyl)-5-[(5-phosphoribosylamino)methylideneamino]imidazole-4-carboxamide isomerase [Solirubrobacterales bacterium]|nr:1-(5-phosphoribosyl)-5-[(5-phosphoribosylamino)methylideneamino]imidazole-4-carboxamide isomerase [Solirubrobacterales bacterium]
MPILYPAIDIRAGRAVRLLRGDYDHETGYDDDPLDAARRWAEGGAEILHIVDLDGARAGAPANLEVVARIAAAVAVPVQLGGGLRDRNSVEAAFAAGAERAVLGTAAQRDPDLAGSLADAYGDRIVASVDGRGGRVAVAGWEEETATAVEDAVMRLAGRGIRRFVHTPVEVDGTLSGPGLERLGPVLDVCEAAGAELIYSGGVGTLDDLVRLRDLRRPGLSGVIVGKALYERRFTVAAAIAVLAGDERNERKG